MKRFVFVLIALLMFASASFAAGTATSKLDLTATGQELHGAVGTTTAAVVGDPLIGKCSTGVGIAWNTTDVGYSIATQHKSGSKVYGTSFDSTSLFSKEVATIGTSEFTSALTAVDTTDFVTTGWKSL